MEKHAFLQYAVILLLAAVIAVPLARRWRLGAVLGYLAAGVLIGPSGLSLLVNTETISTISELGIVLLLFVIGLELSPQRLWVMRRHVFGLGSVQMIATALAISGLVFMFGLGWKAALIVGLGLALSSTAIDLQVLAERKELTSAHGRLAFALLLFQDVAAIPILALIPLLASQQESVGFAAHAIEVLKVIGLIAAVAIGGRYLLRPLFRGAAGTEIPEVFTAAALLVVIGTAWIMEAAGMSMSLGAFLAGVLLADSEYRHEIEARVDSFKGLLLGLFFISVGMAADVQIVVREPWLVGALLLGLLGIKALILFGIARGFARHDSEQSLALAAILCQGGEFAFVVFSLSATNGLITPAQRDLLIVVVTLSMAVTPLLVIGRSKLNIGRRKKESLPFDAIVDETPRVIVAGFGRFGQVVARVLRSQNIPLIAIESSVEQVEQTRRFGSKIYFGDPTRSDLLRSANVGSAEVFIVATDDPDSNIRTARLVRRLYPHLKVYARARNRQHVWRLMDLNLDGIVRETYHSSLVMAQQILEALGMPAETAKHRVEMFDAHDDELLKSQYLVYDNEAALVQSSKEALGDLERLFANDLKRDQSAATNDARN
ncbi:MAG: monovalent cation:proton antiporter-2 (CPA2) family protein [Dokdonella sp.]